MKLSLLFYDIPERSNFPNPSGTLRRRAIRINLSAWVVDRDRTPWQLMDQMTSHQVRWHLFDFDESSTEQILKQAAWQMRAELDENIKREAKSLQRVDEVLDQAEKDHKSGVIGWDKLDAARKKHAAERRGIIKRSETLVKDLEHSAAMFGVKDMNNTFQQTHERIKGIRSLNGARATLYIEMAKQVQGTTMGKAAANADVPAEVLADYIEENGGNATAARTAFAERETPKVTTPVAVAEKPAQLNPKGSVAKVSVPGTVVKTIKLSDMNWDKATRTLSAEASRLAIFTDPPRSLNVESNVTGNKTETVSGKTARFTQCGEDKDAEGETTAWRYYDGLTKCSLVIFND